MKGIRGIRKYLPEILRRLHDGLDPAELDDRLNERGIPHTTLYDILRILEESGVIYKDGEKYRLICRKEIQEFRTREEYKIRMKHSSILAEEVKKVLREAERSSDSRRAIRKINLKLNENFLEHLKEYHAIYDLLMEFESLEEELRRKEDDFIELLKEELKQRELNEKIMSWNAIRIILDHLRGRWIGLDSRVELFIDGEYLRDKTTKLSLSSARASMKRLEDAMNSIITNDEIRRAYEELIDLEAERDEIYHNLKAKLELLIDKINHGEPLRGLCELCPRVKIKVELF
jgi:Fe2+ or Zn2+ uptake regulation protein